jgi:signal transduction histidine kinase
LNSFSLPLFATQPKKQLEAQFLRAQRLESIGTLASGIAHDLNNILNPVLAVAQLLPRKLPQPDESTQRLLEILEANVKRGGDLVNQVLAFARGSDGERRTLQVGHLLTEIAKIAQQTFPKSIEIRTRVSTKDLWLIHANATQVHQVLMNLGVNARDAMPEGGTLTIAAENCVIDPMFAHMHLNAQVGCYVKITIEDTGTGIPPDVLARIFDPFFTTKEPDKGTGLGLSTVIAIVKNHGGFLDVSTEVGCGTSFHVYLPAIEQDAELAIVPSTYLEGNGELILVVDDEATMRQAMKASLGLCCTNTSNPCVAKIVN